MSVNPDLENGWGKRLAENQASQMHFTKPMSEPMSAESLLLACEKQLIVLGKQVVQLKTENEALQSKLATAKAAIEEHKPECPLNVFEDEELWKVAEEL